MDVSASDEWDLFFETAGPFATLVMALLDAWINRQPYYATFHAFIGAAFCVSYMVFNFVYVVTGLTNEDGMPYIYRQLNWRTRTVARFVTPGKITILEMFFFIPVFNMLYWCMLWARRRARVAAKANTK